MKSNGFNSRKGRDPTTENLKNSNPSNTPQNMTLCLSPPHKNLQSRILSLRNGAHRKKHTMKLNQRKQCRQSPSSRKGRHCLQTRSPQQPNHYSHLQPALRPRTIPTLQTPRKPTILPWIQPLRHPTATPSSPRRTILTNPDTTTAQRAPRAPKPHRKQTEQPTRASTNPDLRPVPATTWRQGRQSPGTRTGNATSRSPV